MTTSEQPGATGKREVRLRPEYGGRYLTLTPGVWQTAAATAKHVLASQLMRGEEPGATTRLLPETHFEFRGGARHAWAGRSQRRRREDRRWWGRGDEDQPPLGVPGPLGWAP
jgi:hypothetical protein